MNRVVVCVATTPRYQRGMHRLEGALDRQDLSTQKMFDCLPNFSPTHAEVPYAFKAYALRAVADQGFDTLIWADACILPVADMSPLWERIERDGYWFSRNGYMNDEWTANSAYADLGVTREENANIPHVVATTFGLSMRHELGRAFLAEYFRLASETKAFCGPWAGGKGVQHRHDQTAASVIAWRLGMRLTDPPDIFAYKGGETSETILMADGGYE